MNKTVVTRMSPGRAEWLRKHTDYNYGLVLGCPFSVTPQAVSPMLMRHRRALKTLRGAMELSVLSPRAVNVLGRHGIRTRKQAWQANVLERLADERNCGRKTIDEIARWIGEHAEGVGFAHGSARPTVQHDAQALTRCS
jgi:hypothetical protein